MPPKGSTKRKAETPEPEEVTPKKKSTKGSSTKKVDKSPPNNDETPTKKTPARKVTAPKKPKETTPYGQLKGDNGVSTPIDVKFEGDIRQSVVQQDGSFSHKLTLEAPGSFSLVKTVFIEKGDYAGLQAILIQPAKAFKFLDLPDPARERVYDFYFSHNNVIGDSIAVEAKKTGDKNLYAKAYSCGSRYRVALLAVCSKIYEEAKPIFYSRPIRLENTSILLDFLAQIHPNVVKAMTQIEINTYVKTSARTSLSFLSEATNLTKLRFLSGVSGDADPKKAAKSFDSEAHKFLEAMSVIRRNDAQAAVDVLEFGPKAFLVKSDGNEPWNKEMIEAFKEEIVAKMK